MERLNEHERRALAKRLRSARCELGFQRGLQYPLAIQKIAAQVGLSACTISRAERSIPVNIRSTQILMDWLRKNEPKEKNPHA